jgi:hypothetical protein
MRQLLALVACSAAVWLLLFARDAGACGMFFTRHLTEAEIADKLPYLAVERVLLAWDAPTQTEDFVREARFQRADQAFGFVVPVPSRPEVFKVDKPPFDDLARAFPYAPPPPPGSGFGSGHGRLGGGVGAGVVVLSEQRIGSFTVFVLAANDGGGLADWLKKNGFEAPPEAQAWLDHYVKLGFYYVAFRYDAPADVGGHPQTPGGATAGMTSETVRIRFKTPLPYYPYLEPSRKVASRGPRELLLWFASQEEAAPIAARGSLEGELSWSKPWRSGDVRRVTAKKVRAAIPSLEGIIAGDEGARWVVVPFRDSKTRREGWGDVLLAPSSPVVADGAAIAARWPLLPILDPRLEGDLDQTPLRAASFETLSQPRQGAVTPEPSARRSSPDSPGDAPKPPGYSGDTPKATGCAIASGSVGSRDASTGAPRGALWMLAAVAAVFAARRLAPVTGLLALLSCRRHAEPTPPTTTPEPASTVALPGARAVAFARDGTKLMIAEGTRVHMVDVASGQELQKLDVATASEMDAGTYGADIGALFPLDRHRVLVEWKDRDRSGDPVRSMMSLIDMDGPRQEWTDVTGSWDRGVDVSDDGRRALALAEGKMILRDIAKNHLVDEWDADQGSPFAFAGADRALGAGSSTMQVWDLSKGIEQRTFAMPREAKTKIAVTPDGTRAITLSAEDALRVWDVAGDREVRSFDLFGLGISTDVVLSRDGRRAYTHLVARVCAWDLDAGTRLACTEPFPPCATRLPLQPYLRVFPTHALALSPDGRVVAFLTQDGVGFWSVPPESAGAGKAPWPIVPPVAETGQDQATVTPAVSRGRAEREAATLALLLGRTNTARLPTIDEDPGRANGAPVIRQGALSVNGSLPREIVQRIVRQNYGRFRLCYEDGLRTRPTLGDVRVAVKLVIDREGQVSKPSDDGSDLRDAPLVACVVRGFSNMSFPQPEHGEVTVKYTILFSAGD